MAYENMTYEVIMQRMMDRISMQYPMLDTREGSIIFNAIAAAAIELSIAYMEADNSRNESFVRTATREYILIGCEDMGMDISVFEANAGTHKGVFDVEVGVGSRWNCDLYNYEVIEQIGKNEETGYYEYKMLCETEGTAPNNHTGDLTAITEMPSGLTYAKVTECLIEGENETSDEDIITAYYDYVRNTIGDGNIAQYEQWCNSYDGIGNYKVFPLWNGANTVKLSILDGSNGVASETLIDNFQRYIDPNSSGMGDGVAPIGAMVTVTTATEKKINVSATVKMKSGYTDTTTIDTILAKYFSSLAYAEETTTVAYMNVGAIILQAEGVASISNLTINGDTADIVLGEEEIPVVGTTNWTVS
jgi:uncharacterized phage protein gp47/JayE